MFSTASVSCYTVYRIAGNLRDKIFDDYHFSTFHGLIFGILLPMIIITSRFLFSKIGQICKISKILFPAIWYIITVAIKFLSGLKVARSHT